MGMMQAMAALRLLWARRGGAVVAIFGVVVLWCVGAMGQRAHAREVWEFVDRNGVTHMGNVAPPAASSGVIWLEGVGGVLPLAGRISGKGLARLPGYEVAKPVLEEAARLHALDPALVVAVAATESAFNSEAVSRKGALGLMQVMPATAQRYGVRADSPHEVRRAVMEPRLNAQIGTQYLADLLRMFDGSKELALAAYNAGEGAVIKHGRKIPPYPETQQYVERVLQVYRSLAQ